VWVTRRRERGKGHRGENEAGNREAHAGSRSCNTRRHRTQQRRKTLRWSTNQLKQMKATTAHCTIQNKPGPQGHPHRKQTETRASCTLQQNKQKERKGATRSHATEAPGKPKRQNPPSPAARVHPARHLRFSYTAGLVVTRARKFFTRCY
jgi:hypothetical protein